MPPTALRRPRTILSAVAALLLLPVTTPPPAAHAGPVVYVSPATGEPHAGRVLRPFDPPGQNWLPGHRGVDLALEIGREVLAAGPGTVAFAGQVAGTPTVSIDHADGIRSTYQPVHPLVEQGREVAGAEVIGLLGHPTTHYPGLQWGARVGEDYLNPLSLLPRPTIRLKPLDEAGTSLRPAGGPAGRPRAAAGS